MTKHSRQMQPSRKFFENIGKKLKKKSRNSYMSLTKNLWGRAGVEKIILGGRGQIFFNVILRPNKSKFSSKNAIFSNEDISSNQRFQGIFMRFILFVLVSQMWLSLNWLKHIFEILTYKSNFLIKWLNAFLLKQNLTNRPGFDK